MNIKPIPAMIALILAVTLMAIFSSLKSGAADDTRNFRTLLEQLNDLRQDEPGVIVFIQTTGKITSLDDNPDDDANVIAVGLQGDQPDVSPVVFQEIGDDYVCLGQYKGGADWRVCIPFSNIESVQWLNN
jgi:hypothetical protein